MISDEVGCDATKREKKNKVGLYNFQTTSEDRESTEKKMPTEAGTRVSLNLNFEHYFQAHDF